MTSTRIIFCIQRLKVKRLRLKEKRKYKKELISRLKWHVK